MASCDAVHDACVSAHMSYICYTKSMTPIAIRLSESELAALDEAVALGRFRSRSAALRAGLKLALATDREQAIIESYRQGYSSHPQVPITDTAVVAAVWDSLDSGEPI